MKELKVALLGLAGIGEEYLAVLRDAEGCELVAAADANPELVRQCLDGTSIRGYEDHRSLIIEGTHAGLDLLFVALEPYQSVDFVELAARQGVGVFHKAPAARTVTELQRMVECFDSAGLPFVVSRPWQAEPAYSALSELDSLAGFVAVAFAEIGSAEGDAGWRGDSMRAGGGVLLNGGYELVDMLVSLLGMPEAVYAQCSALAAPGAVRKSDTEDAAGLVLRFTQGRAATVSAIRGVAKRYSRVALTGERSLVEILPNGMTVTPHNGSPARHHPVRTSYAAEPAIRACVDQLRSPDVDPRSTAREHLLTMAVIEAAYLSAKTGSPESPTRFFEPDHAG
ncbi:MAG: Gfo/Idh/MocA family oxidoreductase [Planctomycetes bacterium]|nr:Gfo/Idh/MocA family oxidoreductase [Planctomycetota bacterium]